MVENSQTATPLLGRPALPAVSVGWDAEAQGVALSFDSAEFRQWPFVIAVLEMAVEQAREGHRVAKINAMQQAAMQEQQAAAMLGHLRRNGQR